MIFDLRGLHLGDVLLASPAMRAGDVVIADSHHHLGFLPVEWRDTGRATVHPSLGRSHETLAWLTATGRTPIQHVPLSPRKRELLVIAPAVRHPSKQWPLSRWTQLHRALPGSVLIGEDLPRDEWIASLADAHTVVCPDTGTAHMADLLGVPKVIALHGLGHAHYNRYHPYWTKGQGCVVKNSMEEISVQDVLEKVNG